ncbi:hypothetical protein [Oceanobacillus timonensis]|nr:hypothetical protein [Oceanobacillus timonensis]
MAVQQYTTSGSAPGRMIGMKEVNGAGIMNGTPNEELAQEFID